MGTVSARAAARARLRTNVLLFMCVFPFGERVNRDLFKTEGVLTHRQAKSSLSLKAPLLPGPRAGKTACHLPRGCHRGVSFLNSIHPEQPETRLHWYRRNLLGECFVAFPCFFVTFLPFGIPLPGALRQ